MSGIGSVEVDRRTSAESTRKRRLRSKHQKELLERASADGLTQEAIEALRTTAGWQRWLRVRSHLGKHGLHNQLLVAFQRPAARSVAGLGGWRTLGYEIRDGEEPIRLWAHVPAPRLAVQDWENDGSPPEEKPEGELRLVPVFDQDQVHRQHDLPSADEQEDASSDRSDANKLICLLGQLIKFASEIGAPVNFEPITGVVRGYHEPGTGEIVIDSSPDFPPAARAGRLIYELANVLIDEDPRRRGLRLSSGEREVVAHSVAWCVGVCAGRPCEGAISVPTWWAAENAVVVVRYAALVDRVAARLEAALRSGLDADL
jgi:hypothetical protein